MPTWKIPPHLHMKADGILCELLSRPKHREVVATIPVGQYPWGVAITPAPLVPKNKEDCKHGGYLKFGPPVGPFKNQGQCVSYVEHH